MKFNNLNDLMHKYKNCVICNCCIVHQITIDTMIIARCMNMCTEYRQDEFNSMIRLDAKIKLTDNNMEWQINYDFVKNLTKLSAFDFSLPPYKAIEKMFDYYDLNDFNPLIKTKQELQNTIKTVKLLR